MSGTQPSPFAPGKSTAVVASTRAKCAIWARVSTTEQHTENQDQVLRAWGAEQGLEVAAEFVTEDSAWHNGNGAKGKKFDKAREDLLAGAEAGRYTVILVWAVDRLSRRGIEDTLATMRRLYEYGCDIWSHEESWLATTEPRMRELLVSFMAWMAEQESARRSARTRAGLEAARAKGHTGGRTPALTPDQEEAAVNMLRARLETGKPTITTIADGFGVSRAAIYRAGRDAGLLETPDGTRTGGRPATPPETVETILRLLKSGENILAVAEATGVSPTQVRRVWKNSGEKNPPPGRGQPRRPGGFGHPVSLTEAQVRDAARLLRQGETPSAAARMLGVSRATLYRALDRLEQENKESGA